MGRRKNLQTYVTPEAHPSCICTQRGPHRVAIATVVRNREPTLITLRTLNITGGVTGSPLQLPPFITLQPGSSAQQEVGQIIEELPANIALSYQGVREALSRKFLHKRNIDYEHYSFNLAPQEKDESMGEFISRLKRLARYCAFDTFTTEDALRLRIIEGSQSESLCRRLLKKLYSPDEID
ncbi:hypothetical protein NDU88_006483 [Pleurodeles waltl]|uniref:Retrotransposon gag domain-containing protein n=1 Tax=Pleurodeles waltl TaxID=8319 RepID=A0AAV7SPR8_PLEWA|nr:hypothetical protein NDU88_006483 [Pleurodeles waltl]